MADSLFGFDTSAISREDDMGISSRELSEYEYDVFNDETFNHAVKDNWENGHESLVRMKYTISNIGKFAEESDDGDYDSDLDIDFINKLDVFDIRSIDSEIKSLHLDPSIWSTPIMPVTPPKLVNVFNIKISEDFNSSRMFKPIHPPSGLPYSSVADQNYKVQQPIGTIPSPANAHPKMLTVEEIERNMRNQQQPGMFQNPLMNGPIFSLPPLLPALNSSKIKPLTKMSNHPINMNNSDQNLNIAMPQMSSQQIEPIPSNSLPTQLINMQETPIINQDHSIIQNSTQFDQRQEQEQEVEQNHSLSNSDEFQNCAHQHHCHHFNNNMNNNGEMEEEYDEYANFMSNREKQFLITIQLMQLNTGTPYFDDYYYTMYKERQRLRGIEKESKAHRDNQLNHPFTQPKGHVQMLLRQFNNISKNGMQNLKNDRERHNFKSSTNIDNENPSPRAYTPLQFENSLGKLQCGSLTAPKKIIDMEVVSNTNGQSAVYDSIMQKRSRQILAHIEMLYKIVMKLEDLQNPLAIADTIILKEKRQKERLQLEQEDSEKKTNLTQREKTHSELLAELQALLVAEKIPGVLSVRKGRAVLKRIFPLIKDQHMRWDLWNAISVSLTLFKHNKFQEIEESLMDLYYEFSKQLQIMH